MITLLLIAQAITPSVPVDPVPDGSVQTGWVIQSLAIQPYFGNFKPHKEYQRIGILQQQVLPLGAAMLAVADGERKTLREQTGIDAWDTWRSAEWVVPSGEPGRQFTHRGWLFCREEAGKLVRFPQCLRDGDGDGRFEQQVRVTNGTLTFSPLTPLAYHFGPAYWPTNAINYLGIQLVYERVANQLEFYAQVAGSPGKRISATVSIGVDVLPATVRVLGAELTIGSWDGKRPVVTVKKPMPTLPVRIVRSPLPGMAALIGLRAELVEASPPPGRVDGRRDAQPR